MECTSKNFRKRSAIYDCLCQSRAHPSAEEIYTCLKPRIPDLSLGTVYRNLKLFKEQGLAIVAATVGGVERFDGRTEPHAHFICADCSAVTDLEELSLPQSLTQSVESHTGGRVTECQVSFSGVCRDCLRKSQN